MKYSVAKEMCYSDLEASEVNFCILYCGCQESRKIHEEEIKDGEDKPKTTSLK